jgi:hypothetical protein
MHAPIHPANVVLGLAVGLAVGVLLVGVGIEVWTWFALRRVRRRLEDRTRPAKPDRFRVDSGSKSKPEHRA